MTTWREQIQRVLDPDTSESSWQADCIVRVLEYANSVAKKALFSWEQSYSCVWVKVRSKLDDEAEAEPVGRFSWYGSTLNSVRFDLHVNDYFRPYYEANKTPTRIEIEKLTEDALVEEWFPVVEPMWKEACRQYDIAMLVQTADGATDQKQEAAPASDTPATDPTSTHVVICQGWEESEAGWGVRPDGASLHLTRDDRDAFIRAYWDAEKASNPSGTVPREYSRPCGEPFKLEVDASTVLKVSASTKGIRILEDLYCEILAQSHKRKKGRT